MIQILLLGCRQQGGSSFPQGGTSADPIGLEGRLAIQIKKNQIQHYRNFYSALQKSQMQSQSSLLIISSNQIHDIFEKYRSRTDLAHFPFRLCLQDISPTPKTQPIQKRAKNGARGPYRRYTCEEKQEIICRMLNGSTLRKISEETLIPKRNLIRWKHEYLHNKSIFGRKSSSSTEDCRSDTRIDREWIETKQSISEEIIF